jgi:hypothetical protein
MGSTVASKVLCWIRRITTVKGLALMALASSFGAPQASAQDDFTWNKWDHNGSTMYLAWSGRSRSFHYLNPRQGLRARGVDEGTLLFEGTRHNYNYSGTAYVFSVCGPQPYQVSGTLSADLKSIRLSGRAPIVDRNCRVTSYREDLLEFTAQDDDDCGCECPGEIPVADIDEYSSTGNGTSCPYLYAWNDAERRWRRYGKIIHAAEGRDREAVEEIALKEFATRFRLSEEEPEISFIDKVELRVETEAGAIYALRPDNRKLSQRDGRYLFIPAYKSVEFTFTLPPDLNRLGIVRSKLVVTGYYERLGSTRSAQCYARMVVASK